MKTNLLNLAEFKVLSRENQGKIRGQEGVDLSLCGCSCTGYVTGPAYCSRYIACPHEIIC